VRIKPALPKGTRDFSPREMQRRNRIFSAIKIVFEQFGFEPIETPAMEQLETLTGKYGDEGDRLIFKVLNSGDYLSKANADEWESKNSAAFTSSISDKALRYDLTVPFARYVVQHQNDIVFPFRRYQMQTVWRADRPQKGRYREFYQCDADVIGTNSLLVEAELLTIFEKVFAELKLPVTIKLNNRKILKGLIEMMGEEERFMAITVTLDKLDKIGMDKVITELRQMGITEQAEKVLSDFMAMTGSTEELLAQFDHFFESNTTGKLGVDELKRVMTHCKSMNEGNTDFVQLDGLLARGLDYYTGAIFEVLPQNGAVGSVCGGGRYDDLTGIFGLSNVSGVGISFGVDRIYDAMEHDGLHSESDEPTTSVLFVNFGEEEEVHVVALAQRLRESGVAVEVYPEAVKLKKQMKYANDKQIPFVVLAGSDEIRNEKYTLKNMKAGEQDLLDFPALLKKVKQDG
jgi:histidyl-tRNA synthetase